MAGSIDRSKIMGTKMKHGVLAFVLFSAAIAVCIELCAAAEEECPPAGGLNFVCGPVGAEDLVRVPGTHWIIGSGMAERGRAGRLHLIDAGRKTWEILYPGENPRNELDAKSYSSCTGAPDAKTFGAHGIAIRDDGNRTATILAVNHGREAVEVFKLNTAGKKPTIRWVGCVPMEKSISLNSVAFLPGGGFVATKFYDPTSPEGFGAMMAHKITGGVLEWQRGSGIRTIAGTDLSGANGIEVSKDGKTLYVAAWGSQELVRFSHVNGAMQKTVVKVNFSPDNLRWAPNGKILVTGQNIQTNSAGNTTGFKGWTIASLDPETMKVTEILKDSGESPMQNASVAIDVEGMLWVGPFSGNRVAYKALK
jgi:DNA-binding beta-propeller fold protein YncE